jgi:hypothetical protein
MRMAGGILTFALATLISLPSAQARPRLGPGLLLAPLAIVGGIAGAALGTRKARAKRAYQQRQRAKRQRERAAIRQASPQSNPQARPNVPPQSSPDHRAAVAAAGWAGPLFWPNAYDDVFGYTFGRNDGGEVWNRGFGDALAGLFARPDGIVRRANLSERGMEPAWHNLCGSGTPKALMQAEAPRSANDRRTSLDPRTSHDPRTANAKASPGEAAQANTLVKTAAPAARSSAAQATMSHIQALVKPTPAQQASLDELAEALSRAAERIEAACPERRAENGTERLYMMIARLTAMRQAVLAVQAPLQEFYDLLDDEQKAALDAGTVAQESGQEPAQEPAKAPVGATESCPASSTELPQRRLERTLKPTPKQRAELERFYRTATGLGRFVASTCPDSAKAPRTAPERLDAVKDRLAVLRYAVNNLSPAYGRFRRSLNDAQKTRLGALAQDRPQVRTTTGAGR